MPKLGVDFLTLHKKDGMWISDWSNKDSDDDQGCDKRQKEQIQKAFDLIGKMEKQGWKEIGFSGYGYRDVGLAKSAKILKEHLPQILKAVKSHDADVKKKWGQKKVKMWNRTNASRYFVIDWFFDTDNPLVSLTSGELGGCAALMQKGNEYRLIFTYGSDDDEAGYWSKPVTQIVFKSTTTKPVAKPKAKKPKSGFEWEYNDEWEGGKEYLNYKKYAGQYTIKPAVQKAQKDGWKKVSASSKYGPKIWGLMARSPQWKPWVKDLTAKCKSERDIMNETIRIFNGTASWKKPGHYNPDHMGEDGGWEILTKDNKILLFYYYANDELSTRLMRKTFTVPKAPARKPAAKAKPKAKAKSGRKAPEISATRRKIGTRMRGNDGNMWEVKPAGKSQRWVRGAEDWGGDPEGQLAQALARAREAPAPTPLEITELPKICRTCGDESPQAFGIFDEDDNLITESWFCNTVCADQHPIAKEQSFGAEGDYNDFISGLETYLTKFGYLDHFEAEYGNGVLSGSFSVDIDNPEEFGDVEFDAESIEESDYMVITEDTELPDADSWILYLADPEKFPRGEHDPRFAELFFVTGPGQFVDTNKYIRTARVMGGYAPFMISQNMDETGWLKSPTTIANYLGNDSARSLSVGDIVCNPDTGECYIVANFGYHRLEPTTETFEAPLARHNLHRFRPTDLKKKAGYWRKRGRDSIFRRDKK